MIEVYIIHTPEGVFYTDSSETAKTAIDREFLSVVKTYMLESDYKAIPATTQSYRYFDS